jgi:hypothetical protein
MKKLIILGLILLTLGSTSCSKDSIEQPTTISTTTVLEGTWVFQNQQPNLKLIFIGDTFTLKTNTITIKGVFEIVKGHFTGSVTSREGVSSNMIQPDRFTGDCVISGNEVTFTNFTDNWQLPFSSWYQRQ